jgi:6-phosphogluconolactonase (cycloisomerase 2 family)
MTEKTLAWALSRRSFLKGATAVAAAHWVPGAALAEGETLKAGSIFAYVGTYTGAMGAGSNGEGIYLVEMDVESGELLHPKLVAKTKNPSWIAIHPSRKFLYAVNEVENYGAGTGSVSAFAIEPATGALRALNTVSSEGAGPAYLSLDAKGRFAFVANYGGGSVAVLPIVDGGLLGDAIDTRRDTSSIGSTHAADAPRGSFAVSGHDAAHAHMIAPDPENKFVLVADLGQDRIYSYSFDANTGKLAQGAAAFASLPSGDGPRHFAFHPNGHWLYSIQEEASTVVFFEYDEAAGTLAGRQTVSTLPEGFAGTSFAAEILVSPDGGFLYAANRLADTIAVFAIDAQGMLKAVGETSTHGDYPGQCRIDPSGKFLYACNRRSDNITSFRIHRESGLLSFTGRYTGVGSPASLTFLA